METLLSSKSRATVYHRKPIELTGSSFGDGFGDRPCDADRSTRPGLLWHDARRREMSVDLRFYLKMRISGPRNSTWRLEPEIAFVRHRPKQNLLINMAFPGFQL